MLAVSHGNSFHGTLASCGELAELSGVFHKLLLELIKLPLQTVFGNDPLPTSMEISPGRSRGNEILGLSWPFVREFDAITFSKKFRLLPGMGRSLVPGGKPPHALLLLVSPEGRGLIHEKNELLVHLLLLLTASLHLPLKALDELPDAVGGTLRRGSVTLSNFLVALGLTSPRFLLLASGNSCFALNLRAGSCRQTLLIVRRRHGKPSIAPFLPPSLDVLSCGTVGALASPMLLLLPVPPLAPFRQLIAEAATSTFVPVRGMAGQDEPVIHGMLHLQASACHGDGKTRRQSRKQSPGFLQRRSVRNHKSVPDCGITANERLPVRSLVHVCDEVLGTRPGRESRAAKDAQSAFNIWTRRKPAHPVEELEGTIILRSIDSRSKELTMDTISRLEESVDEPRFIEIRTLGPIGLPEHSQTLQAISFGLSGIESSRLRLDLRVQSSCGQSMTGCFLEGGNFPGASMIPGGTMVLSLLPTGFNAVLPPGECFCRILT